MTVELSNMKAAVLWIDDDRLRTDRFAEELATHGIPVLQAQTAAAAIRLLQEPPMPIKVAVVDVVIPAGPTSVVKSLGDLRTGLMLANWVRSNYPAIRVVGYSLEDGPDVRDWFQQYRLQFFSKRVTHYGIVDKVREIFEDSGQRPRPRIFIVHGHDEATKYQLKNYLQNTLNLGEPTVLHERRSAGKTMIEKFEHEAGTVDIVFVLFTPDEVAETLGTGDVHQRARANVLFEAGYFYAKLERTSGRVIFLVKGDVDLPSDVTGIVHIDISLGIENAGELIRRELNPWL